MNQREQFLYSGFASLAKLPDQLLRFEVIRLSHLADRDRELEDRPLLEAVRTAIEQRPSN